MTNRYDMNKNDGQGAYDLGTMTADEVDEVIDVTPPGKLERLMEIAEEAGVAADEVEMVRKVTVQLVKQAIRAAKKLA
jgi:selenophosphate synthase